MSSEIRTSRVAFRQAMATKLAPVQTGELPGLVLTDRGSRPMVVLESSTFVKARRAATLGALAPLMAEVQHRAAHPAGPVEVTGQELTGLSSGRPSRMLLYADAWTEATRALRRSGVEHLRRFLAAPAWTHSVDELTDERWREGQWRFEPVVAGMGQPAFVVVACQTGTGEPVIAAVVEAPDEIAKLWMLGGDDDLA